MSGIRLSSRKVSYTLNYLSSRMLSARIVDISASDPILGTVSLKTHDESMRKVVLPYKRELKGVVDCSFPLSFSPTIQHLVSARSAVSSVHAHRSDSSTRKLLYCRQAFFPFSATNTLIRRPYSSSMDGGGKRDRLLGEISNSGSALESTNSNSDGARNEWLESLSQAYHSIADTIVSIGKMLKETSDEVTPHIQQLLESQPYVKDVVVPLAGTTSATLLMWFVMPRLLRKLHKYAVQSPLTLLSGSSPEGQISYEKSFWSALEDPARYLVTFMAFSQLGVALVPTASPYLSPVWKGAIVLSFVWFLHRWKTNVFARILAKQAAMGLDREKLIALDKISTVGLYAIGLLGSAEACGVAVKSILTVGGVGGVATAFAAKDIFGNVLNGLSLQFTRPFSIGDNIKAGPIEGQVVEMGLTSTSLINAEKFPVVVPNSLFSSQVIVNKSRARWRAITTTIPVRISDLEKIPSISEDIKLMLRSHPKVYSEKEAPYCCLLRIESSHAELTIGCNLIAMKKDEFLGTEHDILLKAAKIIKNHGAELGSTFFDSTNK